MKVSIHLFQRDYFERVRRTFRNRTLIIQNHIRYLTLEDVLELLEYDLINRKNPTHYVATDGSEFLSIPCKGFNARREGVTFRIDPLIYVQGKAYLSLRSINRLFNVGITLNSKANRVFIRQPGQLFRTMRGDTLRSLSELLNASIQKIKEINKNLKEPIKPGTLVKIPTIKFGRIRARTASLHSLATIKQSPEIAPAIISTGRRYIGTPYKFGAGPYPRSKQFDCSSYTQYLFGLNRISLPRTSRAQAKAGRFIRQSDIEPGDLIFFRRDRYSDNRIGHVGVDIGNGRMLNTYKFPPGVTITNWKSSFWQSRYVTAREIL